MLVLSEIEPKPPVIYVIEWDLFLYPNIKYVAPIWSWPWEIPQFEWTG